MARKRQCHCERARVYHCRFDGQTATNLRLAARLRCRCAGRRRSGWSGARPSRRPAGTAWSAGRAECQARAAAPLDGGVARSDHPDRRRPLRSRSRSVRLRYFVAACFRGRDRAIRGHVAMRWDAAQRHASDHHLRGMRRAAQARATHHRARTHLDHLPQLRAAAASGARRAHGAGGGARARQQALRVERRGRLLRRRGLTRQDRARSAAPAPVVAGLR